VRVLVVAEWYPSRADPVHGVWAHRQALAARDAGADVSVLALRRPVPPIAVVRKGPRQLARWARSVPATLRRWELDGVEVTPIPFLAPPRPWSYASWGRWIAPSLRRALSRERFDLLHAHNVLPTGEAVLRCGQPRFVVSTHGPDIIHVAESSAAAAAATRRTMLGASAVIANSRWAAERCKRLAGGALTTHVVHLGADVPSETPPRRERKTVVTVAHLQRRKRHETVLRALASMPAERRPEYVIVGDGEMRASLEAVRDALGLGEHVSFLGQLTHEEALAEAWRADVFAMPSVEEPFGVAYVEAMAAGVPAIGCEGEGGPEDIAAAGEGMVLVPQDDELAVAAAIERCLRDRERLGEAARTTVERCFTWSACGQRTLAVYEEALK
jgi:glycosyltransferase involved in cell wall biosynthesis